MTSAQVVDVFAPAKINLTLHVTGQRSDGYHLLDSLVAFADVGDGLRIEKADAMRMTTDGPEAGAVPDGPDNLVLRAAALVDGGPKARFTLTKNLAVASGIGGGSADAAAAFRGLSAFLKGAVPDADLIHQKLLSLGADIPMCLHSHAARIEGIGDKITPLQQSPDLFAVLVNPRVAVETPAVFKALKRRTNPAMPQVLPVFSDAQSFIEWLRTQRNDMQEAATVLVPEIAAVQSALEGQTGCQLARMSGSGATCFGLFSTRQAADSAARNLCNAYPGWWIEPAQLGTQTALAAPKVS